MKKFLLLVWVFLLTLSLIAQNDVRSSTQNASSERFTHVTVAQALDVGYTFMRTSGHGRGNDNVNKQTMQLVYTGIATDSLTRAVTDCYYVFSLQPTGFVIVSADERAEPILGYSYDNNFVVEGMPDNMRYWLDHYVKQIYAAVSNGCESSPEITEKWTLLRSGQPLPTRSITAVSPLIQTTWSQGTYYNQMCPADANGPNGHVLTGCVATAMAQIIRYWQWPNQGINSHSYVSNYGTLSVDFNSATYNYNNMPNAVSSSCSSSQVNEVAKLMYHCGVAVDMEYYAGSSGASIGIVPNALYNYFAYANNGTHVARSNYSDNDWANLIKQELNNSRPVLYAGYNSSTGHAFVCDGYDYNGAFHFNWGWGGSCNDAYYTLDALTPCNNNYSYDQEAIIGISATGTFMRCSTSEMLFAAAVGEESEVQTLSVRGHSLSGSINVTVGSGFQVSTNGTSYSTSATLSSTGGTLYLKYIPTSSNSVNYTMNLTSGTCCANVTLHGSVATEVCVAPKNLTGTHTGTAVNLSWNEPVTYSSGSPASAVLSWASGSDVSWYGLDVVSPYCIVHRFEPSDLTLYNQYLLKEISFIASPYAESYRVVVFKGGNHDNGVFHSGEQVVNQVVPISTVSSNGWKTVTLTNPVLVDATSELWFGIIVKGSYVIPSVSGTIESYKSNVIASMDSESDTVFTFSTYFSHSPLKGTVEKISGQVSRYDVYRQSTLIGNTTNLTYTDSNPLMVDCQYTVAAVWSSGCSEESVVTVTAPVIAKPTVTTNNVSNIAATTATCGGNVTSDGGATVYARGVCWSTSPNPTVSDNHTSNGTGTGAFTSSLTGLTPHTNYYVRAYATNTAGTNYGQQQMFMTSCNPVTVNISGTTTINYGGSTTITASGANSYSWSTGSASASITVSPTATTIYSVTGTNSYGCTGTASVTVTVNNLLPTVTTNTVSNIAQTTATCGGNVTSDGGATVYARGVCWSTSPNPTVSGNHTTDGSGTGSFTSSLTGLTPHTTYYVRAYATNNAGTAYGNNVSFMTGGIPAGDAQPCPGVATVTDYDGNVYNTVKIGQQCWMKENLRVTHYADGVSLGESNSYDSPLYYENGNVNVLQNGLYYNWPAVMHGMESSDASPSGIQGICPNGWHLPSNAEWNQLIDYVRSVPAYICDCDTGSIGKALASNSGWATYNSPCQIANSTMYNNLTGFSAYPAGISAGLLYAGIDSVTAFCSATEWERGLGLHAYFLLLQADCSVQCSATYKAMGASVRCILGDGVNLPAVTTKEMSTITSNSATCGGNVTYDGNTTVTARGVCWSTSPNPTIDDNHTTDGSGTGSFTSSITGLSPNTTYYVRAYATNSAGTAYGETRTFTTENEIPSCLITFEMHDSFGDGWNGNKILVHNHDTIQEVTLDSGGNGMATVMVQEGTVELEWVNGSWIYECSFTVTGPCFFYSGGAPAQGVFKTVDISCNDAVPAIPAFTYWTENTCNSVIVHFENNSTDANAATWNINGSTSNLWNPTYEFTTSGNYPVSLSVSNNSCEGLNTITNSVTVTIPEPIITILDTAVCTNELPLTWHGITFTGTGTHTLVLQNANGCDSTVTLNVKKPTYFLSDDFNDGVINTDKWTYTGNAVLEEDGQLKLQQNVTDQDVHLRTMNLNLPANGKVNMDRRFMVHRSDNTNSGKYFYGRNAILINGDDNSYINLEYTYAEYYDGAYHHDDPRNGIYVISKLGGVESTVRLCDITFDSWLTEHVEVDFVAGTLSYYLDTLVSTVTIPGLSSQVVKYYNVEFRPAGWWTGHQQYLDWVDIYGELEVVTTSAVSGVTSTSAICGGSVSSNDCTSFGSRGVCWSTSHFPTLADEHTSNGSGTGTFTSSITGLAPNTTYYIRAYATNSTGTSYGAQKTFTTKESIPTGDAQPCPEAATVTDYDGNVYNTVKIGEQCWMKENLRATHYDDGTTIGTSTSFSTSTPLYYPTPGDVTVYGLLYNLVAATRGWQSNNTPSLIQGVCPTGWHVPSYNEVLQMKNYIINKDSYHCDDNNNNYIAKALASTIGWPDNDTLPGCSVANNPSANNLSGFSFVPHGYFFGEIGGGFGSTGYSWTSSTANTSFLSGLYYDIDINSTTFIPNTTWANGAGGLAVRCVKGNTLATVTTLSVSNIAANSATCGGNVILDGGATVTARGVCWSTSQNPTINDSHTTNGSGTGSFTSSITGLTPNTTYYVRAYATNSLGTIYGAQKTFTTSCSTVNISIAGTTTINYGGSTTLTASGANNYSWSTGSSSASITVSPTATTTYTVTGTNSDGCTGTASVTVTVNSVQPTVSTNSVSNIGTTTATCGGNVSSAGGATVTARGVCWSTSQNPTVNDAHTTNGSGTGSFTSSITGLTPNTTYYVRAYATNNAGTSYGAQKTFTTSCNTVTVSIAGTTSINYGGSTTLTASGANSYSWSTGGNSASITVSPTATITYTVTGTNSYGCTGTASVMVTVNYLKPTVTTKSVSNIAATTASCGGNVTADGGATVTARGVCWSTSRNPTVSGSHTTNGSGTGSFTSSLTGLAPNTTYYVRAYATNSVGTSYGTQKTFTTSCNTVNVSIAGTTSINYGGSTTLTASGANSYSWSTGSSNASITVSPTAITTYTVTGTNSYGCTGTASVTVTVNYNKPTVTTKSVSNIAATTASCGGNVTADGGATVTARGVCWSTSQNPTISGSHTTNGSGTGSFTSNITGLAPNTTYYVRAYATNSVGTSYGTQKTFTTSCNTVNVSIAGSTTIIYGQSTTLTASGANSYSWNTSETSASINVNPTTATTYSVTGTDSYGCSGEASVTVKVNYLVPTVTTNNVSNIAQSTATCGGNVTSNGGVSVTERGVCWSTSHYPTISDSHTSSGSGTGTFTSSLTGLEPGVTYYVRAYATNSTGTAYGQEMSFVTEDVFPSCPVVIETLPFVEDFENITTVTTTETGVEPECWLVVTEDVALTNATKPQLYRGYATSGSYTLRMKNRCVYAMPALDNEININRLQMTFNLRQPKAVYRLQVGVVNGSGEFEVVKTINNTSTDTEPVVIDFSGYAGSGHRIAFRNTLAKGSTIDYSINYIDDIVLSKSCGIFELPYTENFEGYTASTSTETGVQPTCWEVVTEDVALTNATKPQVYRGYASSGNYSLRMKNRCVYAMPELMNDINIQDLTMTFNLRQPNSVYRLQVGVVNEEGEFAVVKTIKCSSTNMEAITVDFSNYAGDGHRIAFRNTVTKGSTLDYSINYIDDININYTNACKLTDLPYREGFDEYTTSTTAETVVQPDCWDVITEDVTLTNATMPQVYYNANYATSGCYSLRMKNRCVFAMPELMADINIQNLKMTFNLRQPKTVYRLQVGVVNENGEFNVVRTINNAGTGTEPILVDFSNYTGDGHRIAFRNTLSKGSTLDYSINYIDDIILDYSNACKIIEIPYAENFDGYTTSTTAETGMQPECWSIVTENVALTYATMPQLYYNTAYANSGSYSLRMKNRCVYAMPELMADINIQDLTMTFNLRQPKTIYRLQVGVVNESGVFEVVKTINNASTAVEPIMVDFSSYAGNGHRIAFRNTLASGSTLDYSINYLDDITLNYTHACEIRELPYSESFDGFTTSTVAETGVQPECWEVVTEDVALTNATKPQVYYNTSYATSGSYVLRLKNRCVYAMPELSDNVNVQNMTMTFNLRQPKTVYRLQVGVVNETGVFEVVKTINNASTGIEPITVDFSGYTGNGHRIAFRNTLSSSSTLDYSINYIDDININYTTKNAEMSSVNDAMGTGHYLESITVYPNPTTGELHIDAIDVQKVECYSQMGQLVGVYRNVNELNLGNLAKGVYTLRITVPQGVAVRKVIRK